MSSFFFPKYCKVVLCSGSGFMFHVVVAIGSLLSEVQERKLTLCFQMG